MKGTCFNCNNYGEVTKHHVLGVKDLQKMYPEHSLKKLMKIHKMNQSPILLLCRSCHDNFEHQKKIGLLL